LLQVIDHWERLQTRMPLAALKQHWKLHSYVTAAAMLSGDLTRADRCVAVGH
jgi:hypothetical protein